MKKPLIGLTPNHDPATGDISIRPTFLRALKAVGAIPVLLPLEFPTEDMMQLVDTLDGFIFTGGPDVHPFYFGEDTHDCCGKISPARDSMELGLLPLVMKAGKPILGVCRGMQLINIGLGGTIYQDIKSQFPNDSSIAHSQPFSYDIPAHAVDIQPGTILSAITGLLDGGSLKVNSMHHQAVKTAAPGLTISAYAGDGLIEAIECPEYPYLIGVQWHPEYLWEQDPASLRLFQSFVDACGISLSGHSRQFRDGLE